MSVLEVNALQKSFGEVEVLKNIDFTLDKGEVIAIIGSSGSGKTTLLRCLNFLEKPNSGTISVNGKVIFDGSDPETQSESEIRLKRLHFGLVFQSFNLFPQYTALQNVKLARELLAQEQPDWKQNRKAILAQIDTEARHLLDQMGLSTKMDNYPHQLSGGQQQRVAIARALIAQPALILADEPTGNLDPTTGDEVLALLRESAKKFNQTVILVTHDMEIASQADRRIEIVSGTVGSSAAE